MGSHNVHLRARVVNNLAAFQLSAALRSAIEIDLFTFIGQGRDTADGLAACCNVESRGVRVLADYLVIHSYLTKEEGHYSLTEESRLYLDRHSPYYLGDPVEFVQAPFVRAQFDTLTDCVRRGGANLQLNILGPDHEMWVRFAQVMAPQMTGVGRMLVPRIKELLMGRGKDLLKILDVAAGHGMFGIAFAMDNPDCRIVAQDWPAVLEVAKENAKKHGVTDRFTTLPGSALEVDFGTDHDLILIPNLIHQFDRETNIKLLRKVRAALKPGGMAAVVEFAPNDDRISPASHAAFALFLLATTPGGDAYTISEIGAMYEAAGFVDLSACELGIQRLIVASNPEKVAPLVISGSHFTADWLGKLQPVLS